jgi:hypothetical protein
MIQLHWNLLLSKGSCGLFDLERVAQTMTACRATAAFSIRGDPIHQGLRRAARHAIATTTRSRGSIRHKRYNRRSDHIASKCAIVDGSNPISGSRNNAIVKMKYFDLNDQKHDFRLTICAN